MSLFVLFGTFVFLLLIRTPIAFCLGVASFATVLVLGLPPLVVFQRLNSGVSVFSLMAIPFFIFAGDLMVRGGIAARLVALAGSLVGHLHGGLGQVNIAASTLFGGISGSAVADASAVGGLMIPQMKARGYGIDYAGESRQLRHEGNTLLGVLLVALLFVFLVLAVQFNSFRDPLVVLVGSVPLALSGAMLFTFLGWTTINIFSQVGFITLVGLIAKNGILIVEFANHLQAEGRSKYEAITRAATTRLRPVLMTTGATVLGHFPLVLVSGPGAEARNSIGIILVAGMLVGTLFTLFVLPAVYMLLASGHAVASSEPSEVPTP